NESIQRVTDGTELVNQSGKTLEEIVGSVKRVTDIIAEISAASQEQASGIDQVNKAITQMDEGTQQNAALVEETASASQSMKEQANELLHKISVFKIHVSEAQKAGMPPVAKYRKHVAVTIGKVYGKTEATLTSARKQEPKSHFQNEDIDRPQTGPDFRAAGVAVGNAKDRRSAGDDFEEF